MQEAATMNCPRHSFVTITHVNKLLSMKILYGFVIIKLSYINVRKGSGVCLRDTYAQKTCVRKCSIHKHTVDLTKL